MDRPLDLDGATTWFLPPALRPEPPAVRGARRVLGLGIRRTRLFQGMTQLELEERSGLDQTAISRLELGRFVDLRLRRLLDVIGALGVDDLVLAPGLSAAPRSSVDEMLEPGRWAAADARARREIETILSRRRSA